VLHAVFLRLYKLIILTILFILWHPYFTHAYFI